MWAKRMMWGLKVKGWRNRYRFLEKVEPRRLIAASEEKAVGAFHRAAGRVPFYRRFLREHDVDAGMVKDIESFRRYVPLLVKSDVFGGALLEEICVDGSFDGLKSVLTSSGYSGTFGIGVNTRKNLRNAPSSIDAALDYMFKIGDRRTFLLNAEPMGVKIPSGLPVGEVSVRSDMGLAVLRAVRPYYEQVVIVSDPHFLKKLVEDGAEQGLDWKSMRVHLVMGGDWFPESLRSYLAGMIGADPDACEATKFVGATLGIAELDLNLFHETAETIRIRRLAERDLGLRKALFGEVDATPIIFQYYPHRTYMEEAAGADGTKELVFTMLSKHMRIPLVRYNAGDVGYVMEYGRFCEMLGEFGYDEYRPRLHLPIVAVGGRAGRQVSVDGLKLTPEAVRSALYAEHEVARAVTGQFWLSRNCSKIKLEIQLRSGFEPNERLAGTLSGKLGRGVEVSLARYREYSHGMEVDYERKFRHIQRACDSER